MTRGWLALAVTMIAAACSVSDAPIVASGVDIHMPVPGTSTAAGYLTLTNNTSQGMTITRVTSPQFENVEMHESVLEDGISRMYALGELTLLAGQSVHFERGGKHLMLMKPTGAGNGIRLDFYAGKAVILTVTAPLAE